MARVGVLAGILGFMRLLSVPIIVLNTFGGVISGIWLFALGEWWALGYGLALLLVSTFALGFVLMPGMIFGLPAAYFLSKGYRVLTYPFALLGAAYTMAVMTTWCLWVLNLYLQHANTRSFIPLLIWSYGTATGPWTYMASKEPDNYASTISSFAAQVGYLVMMVLLAVFDVSLAGAVAAFMVVMLLALAVEFAAAVAMQAAAGGAA
jgi:hypothetical protein